VQCKKVDAIAAASAFSTCDIRINSLKKRGNGSIKKAKTNRRRRHQNCNNIKCPLKLLLLLGRQKQQSHSNEPKER
jgi:hypothetical protein